MECRRILLRPGILPVLPDSMKVPPFKVVSFTILPPEMKNVNLDTENLAR